MRCCVVLFALAVLGPSPARAQALRDAGRKTYDPQSDNAHAFHVASEKWVLVPSVQASWTADDNVFIDEDGEVYDTATTVTPGLSLRYGEARNNHAFAVYAVDFVAYDEQTQEDNETHHLGVGTRIRTGKSSYRLLYDFQRSRDADVEVGDRLERDSHIAQAQAEGRIAPKTSLGLSARWLDDRYEDLRHLDNWEYRVGLRLVHHYSRETDVFVEGAYGWGEYHIDGTEFSDFEYSEVGVGMTRSLSSRTSGTAWLGYQYRTFDGDVEDVEGWVLQLDLETELSHHTTARLGGYGSIRPSIDEAGDTTLAYAIRPGIRTRLVSDRLYGSAGLEVGRYERQDPSGTRSREDDYWGYTLGLDWRPLSRLTLGADYAYTENDSSRDGSDFDRGQFTVRAGLNL